MEFVKVEVSCEYQYNLSEQDVETHEEVISGLQENIENELKCTKNLKVFIKQMESNKSDLLSKVQIIVEFLYKVDEEVESVDAFISELQEELENEFEGTENLKVLIA